MTKKVYCFLVAGYMFLHVFTACAQKFTIPVFPDTQEAVTRAHDMFYSQLKWIVNKRDSLKVPFVLHVGDLVNYDTITHFEVASKGYDILDQEKIPYAIALGNHDTEAVGVDHGSAAPGNTRVNLRKTAKYNRYFPATRFTAMQGRLDEALSDNSYHTFKVKNTQWLVITLEFCARERVAKWMDSVIRIHPKHNVIVLTHFHLSPSGEVNKTNAGYGDLRTDKIFNDYIRPHKNVLLVLSGHVCGSAARADEGPQGNRIYQVLQNYQCWDNGGGYLRLLEIDLDKGSIAGRMFSPFYNKYDPNPRSNIYFDNVKFIKHRRFLF